MNCAIVQPKVERADVSASALQSKYFAGASVMKNVSPCRYYSSTRVAQAEETHSRWQWNDGSQQKWHNVLFRACFLPRGWILISYIPVRSCLSIAASVPWSLFLFRILLIGHCFWNIPIRNLRSVLCVFFFSAIWRNDFLCLWARTEKVQVEAWNATRQPSNPFASYGDMICVDYDLAYDFNTCPQAM